MPVGRGWGKRNIQILTEACTLFENGEWFVYRSPVARFKPMAIADNVCANFAATVAATAVDVSIAIHRNKMNQEMATRIS